MLVVLLYNFDFSFIVYELSDEFNREEMGELLSKTDQSELQVLKITDESSVIHKGEDEIIYQGKIYDVKSVDVKDGVTFYYCLHDENEDSFKEVLNNIISKDSDSPIKGNRSNLFGIQNHFAKKYFLDESFTVNGFTEVSNGFFISNENFSSLNFSSIFAPPPNV